MASATGSEDPRVRHQSKKRMKQYLPSRAVSKVLMDGPAIEPREIVGGGLEDLAVSLNDQPLARERISVKVVVGVGIVEMTDGGTGFGEGPRVLGNSFFNRQRLVEE